MYVNYPDQDKVKKIAKRTLSIDELRSKAYKVSPPLLLDRCQVKCWKEQINEY